MHCLVIGGTGGLGSIVVSRLLEHGHSVVVAQRYPELKLFAHFDDLASKHGSKFKSMEMDVEKIGIGIETIDEDVLDPRVIDQVVFCHGTLLPGTVESLKRQDLATSFAVHCWGPLLICRHFLSDWKNLPPGNRSIIYISSVAAKTGAIDEIAYHASKRAMESAMLAIAREYADYQIRANVIAPGIMNVGIGKQVLERRPDVLERMPMHKPVESGDVAEAILYLLQSQSVTGQNLQINGGRVFSI